MEQESPVDSQEEPITACGKKSFDTQKEAKIALNRIRKLPKVHRKHYKPVREYYCPDCGTWHLTSQSLKNKNQKPY